MKKALIFLFLVTSLSAATRRIVPRADNEGGIGSSSKHWKDGYFYTINTTSVTWADGTQTNSNRSWSYWHISANDMYAPSSGVPGAGRGYNYDIVVRNFDDTTDERVLCGFKLPDEVDLSTNVYVNLYAVMRDDETTGSTVTLHIDFRYIGDGELTSKSAEVISHNIPVSSVQDEVFVQQYLPTVSSMAAGDWVSMEIYRDGSLASDNRNGDFSLFEIEIKYRREL